MLLFRPEALAGPSFQMSFAAVTAIVALHSTGWARRHVPAPRRRHRRRGSAAALLGDRRHRPCGRVRADPVRLVPFPPRRASTASARTSSPSRSRPSSSCRSRPARCCSTLSGWGSPCGGCAARRSTACSASPTPSPSAQRRGRAAAVDAGLGVRPDGRRRAVAVPVDHAPAAARAGAVRRRRDAARRSRRRPTCCVTGDGRHLAVVERRRRRCILRERAGDYVRELFAEASGFDGDPGQLGSRPFSACSQRRLRRADAQGRSRSGGCSRRARRRGSTGPG